MERTQKVPIAVELMPSQDREVVMVMLRSVQPISMGALIESLEGFAAMLKEKFPQSPIEKPPTPKIIVP